MIEVVDGGVGAFVGGTGGQGWWKRARDGGRGTGDGGIGAGDGGRGAGEILIERDKYIDTVAMTAWHGPT
jgi:hypothetical protein